MHSQLKACLYFQFFRDELQNTDGFERQSIFHGKDKQISVRDLWHAWKRSAGNMEVWERYMGHFARKPVLGVSDKASFEPVSSATETS